MIIGVVGPIKAGKGTVTNLLKEYYTFSTASFGEEVRLEAKARQGKMEREYLQQLGFELTRDFGEGYWARRLIERQRGKDNYVLEGFRYPGQIEAFRNLTKSFVLLGITAPIEVLKARYESEISERRKEDTCLFEIAYARDWEGAEGGQSTKFCYDMKDFEIINDTNSSEILLRKLSCLRLF